MDTEKLIQDYIANRLSKKKIDYVENLISTDVNFKSAYEDYKNTTEAFKIAEAKLIKNRFKELDNNASYLKRNKILKITAVAAFIACIFYVVPFSKSNNDIYTSYFETCPNTYFPITRSQNIKDLKFEAFKAYENNEFSNSETIFKQLLKKEDNLNFKFFYAMSLLNQEKLDLALEELIVLNTKHFDYQVESLWYSSLILIKKDKIKSAQKNVKIIQQLNPDFKIKEINTILNL